MNAQKPRGREVIISARIISIFAIIALLFSANLAQAVPITIEITGEITSVTSENVPTDLTDSIHAGDIFTGTYIYDTATQGSEVLPHLVEYKHNSPYGINVSVGGFDFRTVQSHNGQFVVEIGDNYVINNMRDRYAITSLENVTLTDYPSYTIEWILSDSTHNALSSTALPETAPCLNNWDWYRFRIGGSEYVPQGDYWRGFRLEGIVTQAVPEPSSVVLMIMGIFLSRRRR